MNAVIIYDRFDFAAKARAMLERAAHETDETTHWSVKPWRVDMLKLSPVAETALAEAAEAHLIVLAVRQVQSLLPWLMDWLERWASRRQIQEAALGVFGGTNANALSAPATTELSRFAERHGFSFIFDAVNPVEDEAAAFARSLHERAVAMTPTLQHVLDLPMLNNIQHWVHGGGND